MSEPFGASELWPQLAEETARVGRRPVVQVDALAHHAAVNVRQAPQWADGSGCRAAMSLDLIQRIPLGVRPGEEDAVANVKASGRRPVLDLVQHEAIRLAPGCDIDFSAVEPNVDKHVPRVVQVVGQESGRAASPCSSGRRNDFHASSGGFRASDWLLAPIRSRHRRYPEPRLATSRRCEQYAGLSCGVEFGDGRTASTVSHCPRGRHRVPHLGLPRDAGEGAGGEVRTIASASLPGSRERS